MARVPDRQVPGVHHRRVGDAVVTAVESGEIPRERIDTSVERIERVKYRHQIFGELR